MKLVSNFNLAQPQSMNNLKQKNIAFGGDLSPDRMLDIARKHDEWLKAHPEPSDVRSLAKSGKLARKVLSGALRRISLGRWR